MWLYDIRFVIGTKYIFCNWIILKYLYMLQGHYRSDYTYIIMGGNKLKLANLKCSINIFNMLNTVDSKLCGI
jgi:hypothetical protein